MKILYSILVFAFLILVSSCSNCTNDDTDEITSVERDSAVDSIKISPNKLVVRFPAGTPEADKEALRTEVFAVKDSSCSCGTNRIELWEIDTTKIKIEEAKRKTVASGGAGGVRGDHQFYFKVPDPGVEPPTIDSILERERIEGRVRNILDGLIVEANQNGPIVNIGVVDTGYDIKEETSQFFYETGNTLACGNYHSSGWNFVDDNWDIRDGHSDGHGTFVTETLTRELDRKNVSYSILPIKAFDEKGQGSYWNIICAFNYLKEIQELNGDLHIVNASFGYSFHTLSDVARRDSLIELQKESILASLIEELNEIGILIVASAGNDHLNTDTPGNAHFPSSFTAPNLIGVGGYTFHRDIGGNIAKAIRGNYGSESIDLVAPYQQGFPNNNPNIDMLVKNGTSYSTPYATANVAHFMNNSGDGGLPGQIKILFLNSLETRQDWMEKIEGGRYIDTENPIINDLVPMVTRPNETEEIKIED